MLLALLFDSRSHQPCIIPPSLLPLLLPLTQVDSDFKYSVEYHHVSALFKLWCIVAALIVPTCKSGRRRGWPGGAERPGPGGGRVVYMPRSISNILREWLAR